MVDVARYFMEFCMDESCGKCVPCRVGGRKLHTILEKISKGQGEPEHLDQIAEIGLAMQRASLCGLGQTAPNPALSMIKYFRDEIEAHINEKQCPAGVCKDLVQYFILPDKCIGCTLCARRCPVNVISGERKQPHEIDQSGCIKCGECFDACKFGAVVRR
jgi:NADP-reducing hydrogenase subunit HndC